MSLSVCDISFSYRRREVFRGLSTSFVQGVNCLVGVNGAGKTTLFRLMLGHLRPARGVIKVVGDPDVPEAGERMGYLPQEFGFPPRFTVNDFVTYFAWLRRMSKRGRAGAVRDAIERVGLAERADDRMGALSGGMLRRAGLAQALVTRPDIVLLDEPTVGLDPVQRDAMRELFTDISRDTTLIISTHLMEDVAALGGQVRVVHDGLVPFAGTTSELAAIVGATVVDGQVLDKAFRQLVEGR